MKTIHFESRAFPDNPPQNESEWRNWIRRIRRVIERKAGQLPYKNAPETKAYGLKESDIIHSNFPNWQSHLTKL